MQHCGWRLKKLREARGIGLEQLGEEIKISSIILENWECGRDRMLNTYIIVKLAKFFGVTTDYLLGL